MVLPSPKRCPLSCAYEHTIATDYQGTVWGWGKNNSRQLGYPNGPFYKSPQRIGGIPPIHSVSSGYSHVAAVDLNQNVWTWGWNHYGQLGRESNAAEMAPLRLSCLPAVWEVVCGSNHTLALDEYGRVWSWGLNTYFQLGYPTLTPCSLVPSPINGLPPIKTIAAGGNYSLAIDVLNRVWAWGTYADSWTLLDFRQLIPRLLADLPPIHAVSCGAHHAMALDEEGNLYAWGLNDYGQLGLSEQIWRMGEQAHPVLLPNLPKIHFVSCGETTSAAIDTDGKPWVWGKIAANRRTHQPKDDEQQQAEPVNSSSPSWIFNSGVPWRLEVPEDIQFQFFSCGTYHISAIDTQERCWSLGENDRGQLGLGHTLLQSSPQLVPDALKLSPVTLCPVKLKSA